jgi:phage tail sheath protein FI
MPEYLSPGVYVEEVELGPRPIEGVSTSTAGVVGVTERGPEDVPVLVTSYPEYQRLFGSYLDPRDFPNGANGGADNLSFLPHAVEGFFQNGGQRVYVVRVVADQATEASTTLMTQEDPAAFATPLVATARAGDTILMVEDAGGLAGGQTMRVDEGAAADYVVLDATPFPSVAERVIPLRSPLAETYEATTSILPLAAIAPAGGTHAFATTLDHPSDVGSVRIGVSALPGAGIDPLARGDVLLLSDPANTDRDEYVVVESVPTGGDTTLTLRHRLVYPHAAPATTVTRLDEGAAGAAEALAQGASSGSSLVVVDAATALVAGDVVRLGGAPVADARASYNVVTSFRAIRLQMPAMHDLSAAQSVTVLTLATTGGANAINNALTSLAPAGASRIRVDARGGWTPGDWLGIDVGTANEEFGQVAAVPAAPDDDALDLRQPLRLEHASGVAVERQDRAAGTPRTILLQHVPAGGRSILLADDSAAFDPGVFVEIGEADDPNREYGLLGPVLNPALLPITPATAVAVGHPPAAVVQARQPLFGMQAIDEGAWGNELRVSVENEEPSVVQTTATPTAPNSVVRLASTSGVEPGLLVELLELSTRLAAATMVGATQIQVASAAGLALGDRIRIGRATPEYARLSAAPTSNLLTLTQPLRQAHDATEWLDRMDAATGLPRLAKVERRVGVDQVAFDGGGLPFPITGNWTVRSREFRLTVDWVKRGRANPRTPADERVQQSETHRFLSLDSRHSRYVGKIIGSTTNPARIWDRRPEGESELIRITDSADELQSQTRLRPGPDLIYQVLPSGRRSPIGRWLVAGDDDVGAITDDTYLGLDNVDPILRTGLFVLKNQEDISLVAMPGRVSQTLQDAVINHCELMRYRFAVLDSVPGPEPNGAHLPDVQLQRQQFDSKYAALYYPWLRLRNPFPVSPAMPNDFSIPPSGHVLGVYARTDVTRGVHKAPANEVIAGISGLQRALTKGEQDILNPYPMNINVLRDFREQRRGNRVWGARVITSDPDWKYVNVRRLFNYIERSVELGLQWVVFEPNDYDLWARVRRSLSDFLTAVWRSGGLMGKTAEEAFFVRCDRSTMSQNDIDNGRLIVVVGIAPVKPAEFVIIRIGQWQGGSAVEEAAA